MFQKEPTIIDLFYLFYFILFFLSILFYFIIDLFMKFLVIDCTIGTEVD